MIKQVLLNILIPVILGVIMGGAIVIAYMYALGIPERLQKIMADTEQRDLEYRKDLLDTKRQMLLINAQISEIRDANSSIDKKIDLLGYSVEKVFNDWELK